MFTVKKIKKVYWSTKYRVLLIVQNFMKRITSEYILLYDREHTLNNNVHKLIIGNIRYKKIVFVYY